MEVNKDEAERCIELAKKFISEEKEDKAEKFLLKAEKLYPTQKAKGKPRLHFHIVTTILMWPWSISFDIVLNIRGVYFSHFAYMKIECHHNSTTMHISIHCWSWWWDKFLGYVIRFYEFYILIGLAGRWVRFLPFVTKVVGLGLAKSSANVSVCSFLSSSASHNFYLPTIRHSGICLTSACTWEITSSLFQKPVSLNRPYLEALATRLILFYVFVC